MSFWNRLQNPFFVVAPMADVTDPAFRRIIAKYSAHELLRGDAALWSDECREPSYHRTERFVPHLSRAAGLR